MVKFINILAGLGAATVNPDGSIESTSSAATPSSSLSPSSSQPQPPNLATEGVASSASAGGMVCPFTQKSVDHNWQMFHSSNVCNKGQYNKFIEKLERWKTYQSLRQSGLHVRVPTQKTVTCPAVVHDLHAPNGVVGYDTPWVVENTASVPVVLSYVDENSGIEYSAIDADISPPEADPNALVKPGESKVVQAFEGHVFHARELLPDGSLGKVVLQHRVGLIPIGEKMSRNLVCPDVDMEPIKIGTNEIDPEFARTKPKEWKECNTLEIGFRNMAGCPLHGYYLEPDTCEEDFKFHLGVESNVDDFMWDWQGNSKYESTFVGHTFVFRSAFSDQVIDTVTLKPVQIVDCPDLQQTVATALSTQAIILPTGQQVRNNGNVSNNTTTTTTNVNTTAGSSTRPQFGSGSLFYASTSGGSF